MSLIEIQDVDRRFFTERLDAFLPPRIIDIHTHIWRREDMAGGFQPVARSVTWPSRVADTNPLGDLLETYRLMLPCREVTPLVFPHIGGDHDFEPLNAYVAAAAAARRVPALLLTHPAWTGEEVTQKIAEGGFLGTKSYLSYAPCYLPKNEIRITDYFPPHQLAVLDRLGLIMMLHLPRDGRLRDPVNLAQVLEIEQHYPNIKLIIAHVGRAYCDHDVGEAFQVLSDSRRMFFDISANTNAGVFEQLLRCVGPKRVLFGSDLPVARMRMQRVTRGGHYVNLVPRGLYGDLAGDPNMGEVDGPEAAHLTFFLYEEIDACRRAAEAVALGRADVEAIFYTNARAIIDAAAAAHGPGVGVPGGTVTTEESGRG